LKKSFRIGIQARKTPVQERSTATVDAILEATIQVLLQEGQDRLTTTRVAQRAGVSVGTLYQYFPNKQSVLYAVLEVFLVRVQMKVQEACREMHGETVGRMAEGIVEVFVEAKMHRTDASTALYRIAATVEVTPLLKEMKRKSVGAIAKMLATAADARFDDVSAVAETTYGAMVGATRAVVEAGATPKMVRTLKEQLVLLCGAYLRAAGGRRRSAGTSE
jgi:AcrR family transcriptional regulator